jgi:hypothetical protein
MEESLMVPIIMLALLHARDIDAGQPPLMKAAEYLYDWSDIARELNLWYGTTANRAARQAAEELISVFLSLAPRTPAPVIPFPLPVDDPTICIQCSKEPIVPAWEPFCSRACSIRAYAGDAS